MPRLTIVVGILLLPHGPVSAGELVPFIIPADFDGNAPVVVRPGAPFAPDGQRVAARNGHFWRGGRRYRVWGVNLCFGASFLSHADAPRVAGRLAAGGVNSVRLHHMDMGPFPRGIWDAADPNKLSAEALDRLDFFIDALARRGISVNVNLHVSRAHSRYLPLPKQGPTPSFDKMIGIFTPALIDAQKRYARELLTHVNRYRRVRHADDPAVAFVEITNEDSLFMWGAEGTLRNLPPYYAGVLGKLFNAWLLKRYGGDAGLRAAWDKTGLGAGESGAGGSVALFAPAEVAARRADRMRFLAETEKAYFDSMREYVREALGCKALVTGTIVFGPLGLWAQSGMDWLDAHAYWHHPRFPGRAWDMGNWLVDQTAMVDQPQRATLWNLAASRLGGKPFTVSEYNHPAPQDAQAECVPMIAAFAAAQDWDGVWLFAYSHRTGDVDPRRFTSFFDIDANPAKWGFMPAGAVIFRQAGIEPLRASCDLYTPPPDGDVPARLAGQHLRVDRDMFRLFREELKVDWGDALARRLYVWLARPSDESPHPPDKMPPIGWAHEAGKRGRFTASGPLARVEVGTRPDASGKGVFRAATLTSLDGRGLADSRRMLLTVCGRCENTAMGFSADRRTVGRNWGAAPVRIEPVEHAFRVPGAAGDKLMLQPLGPDGKASGPARAVRLDSDGAVRTSPADATTWYLLERH